MGVCPGLCSLRPDGKHEGFLSRRASGLGVSVPSRPFVAGRVSERSLVRPRRLFYLISCRILLSLSENLHQSPEGRFRIPLTTKDGAYFAGPIPFLRIRQITREKRWLFGSRRGFSLALRRKKVRSPQAEFPMNRLPHLPISHFSTRLSFAVQKSQASPILLHHFRTPQGGSANPPWRRVWAEGSPDTSSFPRLEEGKRAAYPRSCKWS